MTVNIESIEIILESESTSRSPGIPLLALNAVSVIQMFEWTGDVSIIKFTCTLLACMVSFSLAHHNWEYKL